MNIMGEFIFVESKQKHIISLKKKKKKSILNLEKKNIIKICNEIVMYHEIFFLNTKQFSFEIFFLKINNL